jgi:hypothetical protein
MLIYLSAGNILVDEEPPRAIYPPLFHAFQPFMRRKPLEYQGHL